MGMDQSVTFASLPLPAWQTASVLLKDRGYQVQMRMIDGQLSFPDEQPPDDWNELRVGTPGGMITIRKESNRLVFVIWGNADLEMQKAWNALVWAFAEAGNGIVESGEERICAAQFRNKVALPGTIKG